MKRNIFSNISSRIFNAKFIKIFLVVLVVFSFFSFQKAGAKVNIATSQNWALEGEPKAPKDNEHIIAGQDNVLSYKTYGFIASKNNTADDNNAINKILAIRKTLFLQDEIKILTSLEPTGVFTDNSYKLQIKNKVEGMASDSNLTTLTTYLYNILDSAVKQDSDQFLPFFTALRNSSATYEWYATKLGTAPNDVTPALHRLRRVFLYNALQNIINSSTTNTIVNNAAKDPKYKALIDLVQEIAGIQKNGDTMGLEKTLTAEEIKTGKISTDPNNNGWFGVKFWEDGGTAQEIGIDQVTDAEGNTQTTLSNAEKKCGSDVGISNFFLGTAGSCSFAAFVINSLLDGLGSLIALLTGLAGDLFNWIMQIGVYGFNSWVTNSNAYEIWKTVILALVTSLLLPLVFYIIIRMLIDNDTSKLEKVLPRILVTALFVYFSFTIVGWLIDQTNILTIYIFRSMTGGGGESIGASLISVLDLDKYGLSAGQVAAAVGQGDWAYTPPALGKVIVGLVALFVLFQGAILLFIRTLTMLLSMIFSPIMLIPSGINSNVDKYRDMVVKYFTNGAIMAPIFMFLLLLAQKIGAAGTEMIGTITTTGENQSGIDSTLLSSMVSTALVVVVLQIAITTAKSMSGEIGAKISGKISQFTGGLAFGTAGKVMRNTIGRGAAIANERGWMLGGKEGSKRHRLMSSLYKGLEKSSFDARKPIGAVGGALESAGMKGINPNLGRASNASFDKSFKKKLYDQQKYHNTLSEEGKKRNIERLRGPLGGSFGGMLANELEKRGKNYKPGIKDTLENDKEFKNKFNKANNLQDPVEREKELTKVVNGHFEQNGKGKNYLEKELNKKENEDLKKEFKDAIVLKNPAERESKLGEIINKIEERNQKVEISNTSQTVNVNPVVVQQGAQDSNVALKSSTEAQDNALKEKGSPAASRANMFIQGSLKNRLREKYEGGVDGKSINQRRTELKTIQRNIEKQREDEYQNKIIDNIKEERGSRVMPTTLTPELQDIMKENKERLRRKYGGVERVEGGTVVNDVNPEIIENKKRNLDLSRENIRKSLEKARVENYQNQILNTIENSKNNPVSSTTSQQVNFSFKPVKARATDAKDLKAKKGSTLDNNKYINPAA